MERLEDVFMAGVEKEKNFAALLEVLRLKDILILL